MSGKLHYIAGGTRFHRLLRCDVGPGGKVGRPDRQVVVIQRGGGFMLHATGLATAVQYGLDVVVLLFSGLGYGILRHIQDRD